MIKHILTILVLFVPFALKAQDNKGPMINQLNVETRISYDYEALDGKTIDAATGFKGKYLNLRLDGQIVKGLNFSYRQRLNKPTDKTFFDATDWLHLDWTPTDRLTLSAGKQVVAIGGYEYDRAPIDLYTCSEFWYNIACYQLGASVSYNLGKGNSLLFQVCNTPFRLSVGNNSYAYNLVWYGKLGFWETMYSVNMMEYARGKWINYIALGNRFNIVDGLHVDVDYTNRASKGQNSFFDDFTIVGELSYEPTHSVRCFGKYTYDKNTSGTDADLCVIDGTKMQMASVGVEWAPICDYRDALRLYATGSYNWGENTNTSGSLLDKQLKVEAGVKFRFDVLEAFNRIVRK